MKVPPFFVLHSGKVSQNSDNDFYHTENTETQKRTYFACAYPPDGVMRVITMHVFCEFSGFCVRQLHSENSEKVLKT